LPALSATVTLGSVSLISVISWSFSKIACTK
jgi:hypothetical protein